jgi:DNA polymerase IV
MSRDRCILHVDMDAFYAAIEQRDDPALRGRPVAVGGTGTRGVVAAASYEARRFGVRSAMPVSEALRRCPALVRVRPRMDHYRAESARIFAIFRRYTPEVEGLSLDEAFLDVTASMRLHAGARSLAEAIKADIRTQLALTASVGIGPNKLVAKIASDLGKPDGLFEVPPSRVRQVLDPLPMAVLPGLGPRTLPRLEQLGLRSLADLRRAPLSRLQAVLGRHAEQVRRRAAGEDDRPVTPEREEKSVSAEETFDRDLSRQEDLLRELSRLADRAASRLRAKGLLAATITLKVRRHDFRTSTRQLTLTTPTRQTRLIGEAAASLLAQWRSAYPDARVRLLGVGVSGLVREAQLALFEAGETAGGDRLDEATDSIRERFGRAALTRARSLR